MTTTKSKSTTFTRHASQEAAVAAGIAKGLPVIGTEGSTSYIEYSSYSASGSRKISKKAYEAKQQTAHAEVWLSDEGTDKPWTLTVRSFA